ncbi:hypothetical protein [Thioclava sp.]|uniref:hypothetical protein n=1 Tax=Thioclava sp. TaxID=1933450 RepID=UPI003AA81803
MKRVAAFLAMFVALAAMGKTPIPKPMPNACEMLEAINIATTLGTDVAYVPGTISENEYVRMSLCSAQTPDLSARMTLMVRETLTETVPDAETLCDTTIDALRATIGATAVIEELDLGDAAIWVGDISQLTVWHHAGRVVFIFTPTPGQDKAAAEAAAREVLAAFP